MYTITRDLGHLTSAAVVNNPAQLKTPNAGSVRLRDIEAIPMSRTIIDEGSPWRESTVAPQHARIHRLSWAWQYPYHVVQRTTTSFPNHLHEPAPLESHTQEADAVRETHSRLLATLAPNSMPCNAARRDRRVIWQVHILTRHMEGWVCEWFFDQPFSW